MGFKKKKNIIILTLCMVFFYILYQMYFFLTITSETADIVRVIPMPDHANLEEIVHVRSDADKFLNENGIIRGVFYTQMTKYRPNSKLEFKCLKSEQTISFDFLNDDYCDCDDGTDEPSTNACLNGTFYCDTQYHNKPVVYEVPSSRVNDGICDCCDGSDEWLHDSKQKLLSQSSSKHYRHYVSKCENKCVL